MSSQENKDHDGSASSLHPEQAEGDAADQRPMADEISAVGTDHLIALRRLPKGRKKNIALISRLRISRDNLSAKIDIARKAIQAAEAVLTSDIAAAQEIESLKLSAKDLSIRVDRVPEIREDKFEEELDSVAGELQRLTEEIFQLTVRQKEKSGWEPPREGSDDLEEPSRENSLAHRNDALWEGSVRDREQIYNKLANDLDRLYRSLSRITILVSERTTALEGRLEDQV